MKLLLVLTLALLMACAPLTEIERLEREQQRTQRQIAWLEHEPDRIDKWGSYKYWCSDFGIMLWGPHSKKCRRNTSCVPRRMDWDFRYKCRRGTATEQMRCEDELALKNIQNWRTFVGNNVTCTGRNLF